LEEFVKQALGFLFQHFVAHDFEEISRETNTSSMYYAAWRLDIFAIIPILYQDKGH
jgi:hypothetical protein